MSQIANEEGKITIVPGHISTNEAILSVGNVPQQDQKMYMCRSSALELQAGKEVENVGLPA
jgi:hypothetical protein